MHNSLSISVIKLDKLANHYPIVEGQEYGAHNRKQDLEAKLKLQ